MWAQVPCRSAHVAVGFRIDAKVSSGRVVSLSSLKRHFSVARSSNGWVSFLLHNPSNAALTCSKVRTELCGYIEGELPLRLKLKTADHIETCNRCRALHNDLNTTVRLLGDESILQLPVGFSQRLRERLQSLG